MAVSSAALTWLAGIPIWVSAAVRSDSLVIREPSMPTETIGTEVVKDAPPMPKMGARAGHDRFVETESPRPSDGMIERGDHCTFHEPDVSLSVRTLRTRRVPSVPRLRWL